MVAVSDLTEIVKGKQGKSPEVFAVLPKQTALILYDLFGVWVFNSFHYNFFGCIFMGTAQCQFYSAGQIGMKITLKNNQPSKYQGDHWPGPGEKGSEKVFQRVGKKIIISISLENKSVAV